MEALEKFKVLFLDVWNDGISGVNISEIRNTGPQGWGFTAYRGDEAERSGGATRSSNR